MLIEQYFYRLFKRNFEEYKDKRIALYGIGNKLEIILHGFPHYNIVAILDKEQKGNFMGKPIIEPEELPDMQIDLVVIVARNQNVAIVAERIKDVCEKNNIKVFSVSGMSMYDFGVKKNSAPLLIADTKSWKEKMLSSKYRGVMEQSLNGFDEKILQLFAEKVFANERDINENAKVKIDKLYDLAYCFLGPIITTYVFFIIKQLREGDFEKVLFAARDGYLIQKLYQLAKEKFRLEDLPEDYYFYTSRMACIAAATQSEEDFFFLSILPCGYGPQYMTQHRFNIPEGMLGEYEDTKYFSKLNYLMAHKDKILSASARLKRNYLKYMDGIKWNKRERYAFVDLVSSGTCQMYLSQISDTPLLGIYLGRQEEIIKDMPKRDLLPSKALYERKHIREKNDWAPVYLFDHYWILETVLTSFEPSLHHFDDEGMPVMSTEKRKPEDLRAAKEMQEGITEFFKDFLELCKDRVPDVHENIGDILYRYCDEQYTDIQIPYFEHPVLYEDLGLGVLDAKSH